MHRGQFSTEMGQVYGGCFSIIVDPSTSRVKGGGGEKKTIVGLFFGKFGFAVRSEHLEGPHPGRNEQSVTGGNKPSTPRSE